jgi:hypothetical protein
MGLSFADAALGLRRLASIRGAAMVIPFRWRSGQAGWCGQRRQRIRKVCLRDLFKRLVDRDGLGWPSRVHDEHDGSGAAATRIAAFAYGDYCFIIGVDGCPGMLFQFTHYVPLVARRPWEENNSHYRHNLKEQGIYVML